MKFLVSYLFFVAVHSEAFPGCAGLAESALQIVPDPHHRQIVPQWWGVGTQRSGVVGIHAYFTLLTPHGSTITGEADTHPMVEALVVIEERCCGTRGV